MMKTKDNIIWVIGSSIILYLMLQLVQNYQKQERMEQAKKAAAYSPPNVVSGSFISLPDRWTVAPLDTCKGFVIATTNPTDHWMQRVNGLISGPFTNATKPADGPVRGVEIRSAELYPIEMDYSYIK
jgi:hypothetical protein